MALALRQMNLIHWGHKVFLLFHSAFFQPVVFYPIAVFWAVVEGTDSMI